MGAHVHDLDRRDRIGQRLIVCIGVQLDDRHLARQRQRNVTAEELSRAYDQMQCQRILRERGPAWLLPGLRFSRSVRQLAPQAAGNRAPDVLHHLSNSAAD